MREDAATGWGPLSWLIDRSHLMSPEDLPVLAEEAARKLGATGARLWLVGRDQGSLRHLAVPGGTVETALGLDGTLAGRAFRMTEVVLGTADGPRMWVPLLDGAERVGVLELLADEAEVLESLRGRAVPLAGLLAELVVTRSEYTDTFERVRRTVPMGVAAEMLWRQLPPRTFATQRFVLSAQLEPWHEVGGDAFDYSADGAVLHLAVFDGMGHGLGATLLTGVALATYRNARRNGLEMLETAAAVDDVLGEHFGTESFVTGVLGRLDLQSGTLQLLCAAHPAPLLLRDGRAVGEANVDPGFPFGFGERDDRVLSTRLEPGDRLVMFSDGVIEARSAEGEFFGLERLLDLLVREESLAQPAPETLRRLIRAVLDHQQGALQDDATVLLLEWAGDSSSLRITP